MANSHPIHVPGLFAKRTKWRYCASSKSKPKQNSCKRQAGIGFKLAAEGNSFYGVFSP